MQDDRLPGMIWEIAVRCQEDEGKRTVWEWRVTESVPASGRSNIFAQGETRDSRTAAISAAEFTVRNRQRELRNLSVKWEPVDA